MIVLAIIIVLVALLLPAYTSSQSRTHQLACATNLRQIGIAMLTYVIDHDQDAPPDSSAASGPSWQAAVAPYVGSESIFRCPSTRRGLRDPITGEPVHYGFHAALGPLGGMSASWWRRVGNGYRLSTDDAASVILVADARQSLISHRRADLLAIGYANAPDAHFAARGLQPDDRWRRHPGGSNICFLDCHVKAYKAEELLEAVPVVASGPSGSCRTVEEGIHQAR